MRRELEGRSEAVRREGARAGRAAADGIAWALRDAAREAARLGAAPEERTETAARPPRPEPEPSRARLVVVDGGEPGRVLEVGAREVVVGRGRDADVSLPVPTMSRRHVRLRMRRGRLEVEDLGSKNGTLVNGGRVRHLLLQEGDRLRLGGLELRVVLDDELGGAFFAAFHDRVARDEATGLLSGPAVREALRRALLLQGERQRPLALAVVELEVAPGLWPERLGRLLGRAGAAVTGALGPGVTAGRIGARRLLVELPASSPAPRAAERLRAAVQGAADALGGWALVHVGIAAAGSRTETLDALLAAADAGLEEARRCGGGRVGRRPVTQ